MFGNKKFGGSVEYIVVGLGNPDKKYEIKTQTVPEITYQIDGPSIQLLNEISTRNPNYADSKEGTSILKLKSLSDFFPIDPSPV